MQRCQQRISFLTLQEPHPSDEHFAALDLLEPILRSSSITGTSSIYSFDRILRGGTVFFTTFCICTKAVLGEKVLALLI